MVVVNRVVRFYRDDDISSSVSDLDKSDISTIFFFRVRLEIRAVFVSLSRAFLKGGID